VTRTDRESPLTVALDTPAARTLADQASIIEDLQFVMDCCKRLLTELAKPQEDRDGVVPQALWSAALTGYARCFSAGRRSGLTVDDVQGLPLQGAVMKFHTWITGEHDKLSAPAADPFEAATIGAMLAPPGRGQRRVEGIAIFSSSRVLIDVIGVRQLGGLASELAKRTAQQAEKQQDAVLSEAKRLDMDELYAEPPLNTQQPDAP
jgi:hypothetical protein